MRLRVGAGWAAAVELSDPAQHSLQQFPDRTATADRAGEGVGIVAEGAVGVVVVEVGQILRRLAARTVHLFAVGVRDTRMRGEQTSRLDHAEAGGRVGNLGARRDVEGLGGRTGSRREVQVDHRSHGIGQQVLVRGERAVTLDGEIPSGQR